MLLAAVVAFAFYAPSLRFGFFNDDPTGHFRWMEGRSTLSLLTDASGHSYYRPVSFILWQILYAVLGRHDPFVLHLLNVLAHAANAALVAWLAHRLTRRPVYAALSGVLFALYPFSYEAVPYVGSFVHPLVTLLILLTLAFYLRWHEDDARWAFVAAHITLTLAIFTQENAIITPLLILAQSRLNLAKVSKPLQGFRTSSFFAEPAAFILAWLLVPKTAAARPFSLDAMRANVLPFVQALVYPVAPLANHNATLLAALALVSVTMLFVLARYARATRVLVFGLLVWALASLPSIVILDNAYVLGSPRLSYLASVGAALLWALPVLRVWSAEGGGQKSRGGGQTAEVRRQIVELGVGALVFVACYLPAAAYTRCELAYQGMSGEIGRMMATAAQSVPPGRDVTFVNLPYFFSSRGAGTQCANPFVFAPSGAVFIPPYSDPRDFVQYNGGPDVVTLAVTVQAYQPGWNTFGDPISVEELHKRLWVSRVFVFDLVRWQLFDLSAVWQPGGAAGQASASFDGAQTSDFRFQMSNGRWIAALTWQAVAAMQDRKVFVHVYEPSGKLVAQDDSIPAQGWVPTSWWRMGDVITDTHVVNISRLPPGTYRVTTGMYDAVNGLRTEARGADGARLPDDELTIGQITQ